MSLLEKLAFLYRTRDDYDTSSRKTVTVQLYDPRTGFQPPLHPGPHTRYLQGKLDEIALRIEANRDDAALFEFDQWLGWLDQNLRPGIDKDHLRWALLLGKKGSPNARQGEAIKEAIASVGFGEAVDLMGDFRNDADLLQTIRSLKLLVVESHAHQLLPSSQSHAENARAILENVLDHIRRV